MTGIDLVFHPLLPWGLLALGAVVGLALVGIGIWRRSSGIGWRALALAVILLPLAGPSILAEQRERLADELANTVGVVDHGLFPPYLTSDVLIARAEGVEHRRL